jgi:hypothetical protein
VGHVLAVSLLLVLELLHDFDQHTALLPKLLLLGLELLDVLHQGDQLPSKRINLLEHGISSDRLQRGQESLGFRPQSVNVLLVTFHLFVQTLHLSQTLLDNSLVVSPRLEGNFCRDGVLHALHLRTQ